MTPEDYKKEQARLRREMYTDMKETGLTEEESLKTSEGDRVVNFWADKAASDQQADRAQIGQEMMASSQRDFEMALHNVFPPKAEQHAELTNTEAVISYRFYDFVDRTWKGYSDEHAHALDYDTAKRLIPQFKNDQERMNYLCNVQQPHIRPFEALLVILLNSA